MRKHLLSFVALIMLMGMGLFTHAQETLLDQPAATTGMTGATSAFTGTVNYEVADNFSGLQGTVNTIEVVGLYAFNDGTAWANCTPPSDMAFNVRFYAPDATQPDWANPTAEFEEVEAAEVIALEPWSNGFNVWRYVIDLPEGVAVDGDGWIGVQSSFGQCWFLWHNGTGGDAYAYQVNHNAKGDRTFAGIGMEEGSKDALAYDVAMKIIGTPGGGEPTYTVTFNVDMTDAMVGEMEFDPTEHHVFVTGTFADWAQPGSNNAFKMSLITDKSVEEILWEDFSGATTLPGGWTVIDADGDGYNWRVIAGNQHNVQHGENVMISESWRSDVGALTPDNWVILPEMNVAANDWELEFYVKAQDPAWAAEKYSVLVSTSGTDPEDFDPIHTETLADDTWLTRTLSLADFNGETIRIAFRHFDVTDMFQIVLDAVKVTGTAGDPPPPPDELFYTLTVNGVEAHDMEYKYFVVIDAPSWDMGEWTGDPNREVEITEDTVLNDTWAVIGDVSVPVVVAENQVNLFPNPATTHINVSADQVINDIRIFDISGRMVHSQIGGDQQIEVSLSNFRQGLYIMQVSTPAGVVSHKFNVNR